jgi:hypothetical protein
MRFLAVDDTEIVRVEGENIIKGAATFSLHQRHSKFKGNVSQEVVHLIECFKIPRSVEEAKANLEDKGYKFPELAQIKLTNTIKYLVQIGVLVHLLEDGHSEFSPIIEADPGSLKAIDLSTFDLDALASGVGLRQDNHPYPDNALDTLSGNSRGKALSNI